METVVAQRWSVFAGHPLDALVTGRRGGVSAGVYAELNLSLGVGDDPDHVVENRHRAGRARPRAPGSRTWCSPTRSTAATWRS